MALAREDTQRKQFVFVFVFVCVCVCVCVCMCVFVRVLDPSCPVEDVKFK